MLRLLLLLFVTTACRAALVAQPLTPLNTSVLGGESRVYSARFFDAAGQPAAGERVTFDNDACGFFDNGGFSTSVVADAQGVATARFTARPQGITCWITAQAGASVRFNVFTYTIGQVSLSATWLPETRPGWPFTFTAAARAGVYPIYNAPLSARVVPAGAATIRAVSADSGEAGRMDFVVTPQGMGRDFEIEVGFRGLKQVFAIVGPTSPLQDMWWAGPAENGWGMSVVQHGDRVFATIYAYDEAGAPTWYVMPGGTWNATKTVISGALYSPRGTPYTAYDASRLRPGAPVGSATIDFSGANDATLAYEIGSTRGTKAITRQPFGPPETVAAPVSAGDMWWGGPDQDGWGIALLQQYRTIFGVWFTYDASGAPTWFVMPAGFWSDASTWSGRIYRTRGSPWLGRPYDPGLLSSTDAGWFSIRFDGEATVSYTIDGKSGTMALMRQAF